MSLREPVVTPIPIAALRPTQMTVGLREVEAKRLAWRRRADQDGAEFLGRHMIPVVLGPKDRRYVIDHHHFVRALAEEGVTQILTNVVADLRAVDKESLWVVLDHLGWCHPYDADGVRQGFDRIPHAITDLADDPYRSLAGALRREGGFAKEATPFNEFLWADFLRRAIKPKAVAKDFDAALARAFDLAKSQAASYLPGWCGPVASGD